MSRRLAAPVTAWPARGAHWLSEKFLIACIALGRRLSARRLAKDRVRTLWGVTPIVTLPLQARCDELLGLRSESLVFTTYYIARNFTWNLRLLARAFNVWPAATKAGYRVLLGVALLRYDVFHIFADRGIMQPVSRGFGIDPQELSALKAANKQLYVFAYGADVRTQAATRALGRWNFCVDCDAPGRYCVCDDTKGRDNMALTAAHATALVSSGDMLAYMPGAHHIPYWPIDGDRLGHVGVREQTGPLRIAHAPNHTIFKGTTYLEDSIARLRARGFAVELHRLSGVPNKAVLQAFADADIVADQFIGGAYGYTALEALARGKPVLTYVRDSSLVVAADECPFLIATPDNLDDVLAWACEHRARLSAIGQQGRRYVERHHSLSAVAARFAALYGETASFPDHINARLEAFGRDEAVRRQAIAVADGWQHPWQVDQARVT